MPEIAKKEANETSFLLQDCQEISRSALVSLRVASVVEGDSQGVSCSLLSM